MIDPFIITLIVSGVVILGISLSIVKNSYDIINSMIEYFHNRRYYHLVISRTSSMPSFVAMCEFISENRNKIKCKQWQIISINDGSGKQKDFIVPSAGRCTQVKCANDLIVTVGITGNTLSHVPDVATFKIFFPNCKSIETFMKNVLAKYMTAEDLNNLLLIHAV